jgi:hypothetical protein
VSEAQVALNRPALVEATRRKSAAAERSLLRTDVLYASACAAMFLLAVVLVNPVAEIGMLDDWCYTLTARDVATTGHLGYHGLGAPMIGPQAYWAALFIRLFGFSFTAVRMSTILLALVSIAVLYALGRAAGLRPAFASFAVMACVLSPIYLPQAVTFMTDAPGLLFVLLGLLAYVHAWKSAEARRCILWMTAGTLAGALAGCTRQIYWILPLTSLSVIAIARWRNRDRLNAALAVLMILASVIAMVAVLRWFGHQPYTIGLHIAWGQRPLASVAIGAFRALLKLADTCALLLIPVLMLYLRPATKLFSRKTLIEGITITAAAFLLYDASPRRWTPRLGNILTPYGLLYPGDVMLGTKPVVLTPAVRLTLGALMFASLAPFLAVTLRTTSRSSFSRLQQSTIWPFLALSVPFALVSALALCGLTSVGQTWAAADLFDRYAIPFLPMIAIAALWAYQSYIRDRVPAIGCVVLAVFAAYATASTHDAFVLNRARLNAAEALRAAGVPRNEILAGVEYDGATEVEIAGHVNDYRVVNPASAYQQARNCTGPADVQYWFRSWTPHLQQRYFVTSSRLTSLVDAPFATVTYSAWLPPHTGEVFTQMLPDRSTVQCQ